MASASLAVSAPGVSPSSRLIALIVVAAWASSCGICAAVVPTWAEALATSSPVVSPPLCRSCVMRKLSCSLASVSRAICKSRCWPRRVM